MLVTWKERPIPSRARLSGVNGLIGLPSKTTCPPVGASSPLSRLNNVVFPAPLGPMTAWTDPLVTCMLTPSTATRLPNRRSTSTTSRTSSVMAPPCVVGVAHGVSRPVRERAQPTS